MKTINLKLLISLKHGIIIVLVNIIFLLDFIKDIFIIVLKLIKLTFHYSTLIISNQMDRDFALKLFKTFVYESISLLNIDKDLFLFKIIGKKKN